VRASATRGRGDGEPGLLRHGLIANYIGHGWTALIGLVFVPVYIGYLGIEAYGLVGIYTLLQVCIAVFLGGGVMATMIRTMSRCAGGEIDTDSARDLLRTVELQAAVVAVIVIAALWLTGGWLAEHWLQLVRLPKVTVANAFTVMGLVLAVRFAEAIYLSSLIGLQRQILFNAFIIGSSTLRSVGAVAVLAWYEPTIDAFFIWQGLVSILTLAVLVPLTYSVLPAGTRPARISTSMVREVMPFAGGMFAVGVLGLIQLQGDKLILSRLLPLSEYGYYTFASVVASGMLLLRQPVVQSWLPRLTELRSRGEEATFRSVFHAGAQMLTVVTGSLCLVLAAFAPEIIGIWTRDPDLVAHASGLITLLVLGNAMNSIAAFTALLQTASGRTRVLVRAHGIAVMFMVPAMILMAQRAGAMGAAWVWLAMNAGYLVIATPFLFRGALDGAMKRWALVDVIVPLAVSALVVLGFRVFLPSVEARLGEALLIAAATVSAVLAAGLAAPVTRFHLRRAWRSLFSARPRG
jgi:O-antigen/teichoic acid export membrane protein